MRRRNAIIVGLLFVIVGTVYFSVQALAGWPVDIAGTTLLLLTGVAMGTMAYVLIAGTPND